jgi:hypothetical protein
MGDQRPVAGGGFHAGELAVQERAHVRAKAQRLAGMLEPAELGGAVAGFLADRTSAVLTARDRDGRLWASPLIGSPGFLEVMTTTELFVHARPLHDAPVGQDVGLVVVEFAAGRRIRLNGRLVRADNDGLRIEVEQAYGNCPQYIQRRVLETEMSELDGAGEVRGGATLMPEDIELIRAADTFFLGTTHPVRGSDASHRGGPPGFVRVDGNELWWPDYKGNNMFNSFGNLAVDPEAALLFLEFDSGRTLHLSGTAELEWSEPGTTGDDGHTGRRARFSVQRVVAGQLLPGHQVAHEPYARNPQLTDWKVQQ